MTLRKHAMLAATATLVLFGAASPASAQKRGPAAASKAASDPYTYPLGPLPKGFAVHRPQRPAIAREAEVRTAADFERLASRPGTRVRVRLGIPTPVTVRASDVEVLVDPGVRIHSLMIAKGLRRVRVSGGEYGWITLQLPNAGAMGKPFSSEDYVHDVMIDGVTVTNADSSKIGIEVYGRRVAIVNTRIKAGNYAIWGRGIEPGPGKEALAIEDLIVAGSVLESHGKSPAGNGVSRGARNEATVRLRHIQRSAIVDCYLVNSVDGFVPVPEGSDVKANYRIHGKSDQNLFARNVLVNSGTQFGFADDDLGSFYFLDNVLYHSSPDLFNPKAGNTRYVEARGNVVYTSTRHRCLGCGFERPGWKLENNPIKAFRTPPKPPACPRTADPPAGSRPGERAKKPQPERARSTMTTR
jgi:hypothetical protein